MLFRSYRDLCVPAAKSRAYPSDQSRADHQRDELSATHGYRQLMSDPDFGRPVKSIVGACSVNVDIGQVEVCSPRTPNPTSSYDSTKSVHGASQRQA